MASPLGHGSVNVGDNFPSTASFWYSLNSMYQLLVHNIPINDVHIMYDYWDINVPILVH